MIHEEAREQTEREDDIGRRVRVNKTTRCPLGEERRSGKGPSWGGRRSNEPTSHGVVPTRAPSCFFLLLRRCLPRVLALLALFSLSFLTSIFSFSLARRPSRAYIIHISTLMFFDYVVRRSTFSPIFLRLLQPGPQQATIPREIVRRKVTSRRPADLFRNKLRRFLRFFPVYSRSFSTGGDYACLEFYIPFYDT